MIFNDTGPDPAELSAVFSSDDWATLQTMKDNLALLSRIFHRRPNIPLQCDRCLTHTWSPLFSEDDLSFLLSMIGEVVLLPLDFLKIKQQVNPEAFFPLMTGPPYRQ